MGKRYREMLLSDFEFSSDDPAGDILTGYKKHGFALIRRAIDYELVAEVQKYLGDELGKIQAVLHSHGVTGDISDSASQIQEMLDNAAVSKELRHLLLGHFPLEVRLSEHLKRVATSVASTQFMKLIQGAEDLFCHLPLNARWIVPNQTFAAVPPHFDAAYNKHMQNFTVMWMPLCEIDEDCGGVRFYPGSGNLEKPDIALLEGGDWLQGLCIEAASIEAQPMSPGDIVIFDDRIVHESMLNASKRVRLNLEVRFINSASDTTKHCFDISNQKTIGASENEQTRAAK